MTMWRKGSNQSIKEDERSGSFGRSRGSFDALTSFVRNLSRRDCPLGSSLASVDLSSDEISATGSPQSFALLRMTFYNVEILHYVQDDNVKARVFLSAAGKLILPVWVCFQLGSYFSRFLFVFVHISCFFT